MGSVDDSTADTIGLADTHVDPHSSPSGYEHDSAIDDSWMTSMAGLLRAVAAAPSLDGAPVLAPGDLVDDSFRVESLIAAGGMGVVYLAHDVRLGRKVALKIHLRSSNPDSKKRLMREASAMARLTHPNVLTVHEVGWIQEHLFVAMEYVDGWTLRTWLDAQSRTTREILDVLTKAGDGLAAAHGAGFVHRDFKPDNVLIGRDGRVLVADFGLVRTELDEEPDTRPQHRTTNPLDHSLTITGARMGTPAYMAPEQMRGDPVDARADQFSYCVALYEALFDGRPYAGRSAAELRASLEHGKPRPPADTADVPSHVTRAIMRGVAADPAARHAGMNALLAELRDDPTARRRKRITMAAGALGVLAVAGAAAFVITNRNASSDQALCTGGDAEVRAVWDTPRRTRIGAAFTTTKVPYAATAWQQTSRMLDGYAARWIAAHKQACEDVRVRKVQSTDMLDRRMGCLRGQLRQVDSLLHVFAKPDATIVEKAIGAASRLPEAAACADVESLLAEQKPPKPTNAERVRAVSTKLDTTTALVRAGKAKQALPRAKGLVTEAKSIGYGPLLASAQLLLGKIQRGLGDYKAAETTLSAAYFLARKTNFERVSADAAAMLVWAVGYDQARHKEAMQWAGHAQVELKRPQLYPLAAIATYSSVGVLFEIRGEYAKALVQHNKALAFLDSLDGERPVLRARVLNHVGTTMDELGRLDEATKALETSISITESVYGPGHPNVLQPLSNLGLVQTGRGELAKAVATQKRVLAITESVYDASHLKTGYAALNLGVALHRSGMFDDSLSQFQRALDIVSKRLGADHPDVALCHNSIAAALQDLRRYDEALVSARKAMAINVAKLGKEHQRIAENLTNIGTLLTSKKSYDKAIAELTRAVAIYDKVALGTPHAAHTLVRLGIAHLEARQPRRALAPLERALALQMKGKTDKVELGVTRLALARGLWSSGLDKKRATDLARRAYTDFASSGPRGAKQKRRAHTWLRKRGLAISTVEAAKP